MSRKLVSGPGGNIADPNAHLLKVVDLKTHYLTSRGPVRAVDGVSLTLDRGKTLGVVGESGSGKTQLSRSIMGLLPTKNIVRGGQIFYEGHDIIGFTPNQMRTVWVPPNRWGSNSGRRSKRSRSFLAFRIRSSLKLRDASFPGSKAWRYQYGSSLSSW